MPFYHLMLPIDTVRAQCITSHAAVVTAWSKS